MNRKEELKEQISDMKRLYHRQDKDNLFEQDINVIQDKAELKGIQQERERCQAKEREFIRLLKEEFEGWHYEDKIKERIEKLAGDKLKEEGGK